MKRLSFNLCAVVLLVLLALLAYANAFNGPFIFDDISILVNNPDTRSVFPLALSPRWLVNLSFKLNYLAHGYAVAGYHALNLIVHVGAALLLYGIIRRTLRRPLLHAAFGAVAAPLALAVAALWMVHPLQTESVTYICQRYESLMGLCLLGTLYTFIRAVDAQTPRARRVWANVALIVCALGMGTKEVMVVTPLILWFYDAMFVGGSWGAPWRERRWLHMGFALTIGMLVMFELIQMGRIVAAESGAISAVPPSLYLATQTEVILHYLRLSVWPSGLCLDYAWPVVAGWGQVWWQAVLVTALGVASLWGMARWHPSGFLGVVFFLVLAPTSSLLPVPDIAFEHRMYLPLISVVTALVLGGYRLLAGRVQGRILWVLAATVALTLAGLTAARNRDYRSELAMWRDVATKRPQNLRASNDLAIALAEAGEEEEAIIHFQNVLEQIPSPTRERLVRGDVPPGGFSTMSPRYHYFRAHANLGRLLARHPATRAQAIRHYVLALRAAPRHPVVEINLRDALEREGIPPPLIEAEMVRRITDAGH